MKVLVTGGAGFIGSHTVDLLIKQGFTTIVLDLHKSFAPNPKARYYLGDITNQVLLKQIFAEHTPSAVIHLAAQVCVQTSMNNPAVDAHTNILGTILLLEHCRRYHSKMIFASSAAVYGLPVYLPTPETHPTQPISNYGLSKLAAEHYIKLYHQQYGIEYCILRYANVYGPRQGLTGEGGVISIFINKVRKGKPPVLYGNGEQTRDFIYVEDVTYANLLALNLGKNQTFNVGTNRETSINNIIQTLQNHTNHPFHPIYQPIKSGDISNSCLDSTRISTFFDWSPTTTITEGIAQTIEEFTEKPEPLILN
nr:NAD-dependent epimerase/dehydratase family protein [Neobacillus sp. Marseille-Q6967]